MFDEFHERTLDADLHIAGFPDRAEFAHADAFEQLKLAECLALGVVRRLWDVANGKPLGEPLRHERGVHSVCFSPDGRKLVTKSAGEISLSDVASGKPLGEPLEPAGGRLPGLSHGRLPNQSWIRDPQYLDQYSTFWFRRGGEPRDYSFWAADAIYARFLANGNKSLAVDLLPDLVRNYEAWGQTNYSPVFGPFHQIDDRDGMEFSIGGSGYRPTISSYMYGDALAISRIAELAAKPDWPLGIVRWRLRNRHHGNRSLFNQELAGRFSGQGDPRKLGQFAVGRDQDERPPATNRMAPAGTWCLCP